MPTSNADLGAAAGPEPAGDTSGATPTSPAAAPANGRPGLPAAADCRTALRRTPASVWNDDVTDWAAALTYYAMLAIFPALLVTVSLIGAADPTAVQHLIDQVGAVVPAESRDIIERTLEGMADRGSALWLLVTAGAVGALWSASSYLAVFRRALHTMHGAEDRRPVWKTAPRVVITALVLLVLLISSAMVLMLTDEAAGVLGRSMGVDSAGVTAWNVLKWPLILGLAAVLVLVLFRTGPAETRGVRRRAVGGALAVALWVICSAGFALYVSYVDTYSRLYGSLAGMVVFLVWLWVSNLALLTGAQFNAELAKLSRR
ncbi:YihY/virulence factor BrkB family protein [Streptomyces sp. NPDC047108]|uniref:YihY/virulence factor BrkB family protein n=1 Tax=Streptomyces sp. NPDC047108 TaxID=3155025 RepID=UPI0033CFB7D0